MENILHPVNATNLDERSPYQGRLIAFTGSQPSPRRHWLKRTNGKIEEAESHQKSHENDCLSDLVVHRSVPNHVVLAIGERPSLSAELCQKPCRRQLPKEHQPTHQRWLTSCVTVGPAVKWPAHHQRRATLRVHSFCPVSCVSGLEPPFPQEPVSETVLASRCWWHRWVVVADTNSASTLRSFRSEGCVRHELGVNPPLFPFGGLCRLLWRRQVAYQRRGAARRSLVSFFLFFPPFFCHATSRGQY